jgi:hypothetical protein
LLGTDGVSNAEQPPFRRRDNQGDSNPARGGKSNAQAVLRWCSDRPEWLILERTLPVLKSTAESLTLPAAVTPAAQGRTVLEALALGEITMTAVAAQARVVEAEELLKRSHTGTRQTLSARGQAKMGDPIVTGYEWKRGCRNGDSPNCQIPGSIGIFDGAAEPIPGSA